MILASAAIILLTVIDQLIKGWAIANLQGQPPMPFLPIGNFDWMHLNYLENDGAAFSMLSGSRGFLILFPIIMIFVAFYLMVRKGRAHKWLYLSLPLITAGGLGNLIDRMFRDGKVVDYLDFQLCKFAVFNFADCCVTVGVIVMMFCILFVEKEVDDAKKLPTAKPLPYEREAAPLQEAEMLSEADPLSEAGMLQEADALPEADMLETTESPAATPETGDHAGH